MRRSLIAVTLFVALTACDNKDCAPYVSSLEASIAALPPGLSPVGPSPSLRVPEGRGEPITAFLPVIEIGRGGIQLDGNPVTVDSLPRELQTKARGWTTLHPREPYPNRVHVWADRDVTMADLWAVLAPTQHSATLLVVDPSVQIEMPPCPATLGPVCSMNGSTYASDRAMAQADAMTEAVGDCEELEDAFARVARAPAQDKFDIASRALPRAVRECDCDVDMPAFEFLLLDILGGRSKPTFGIALADMQAAPPEQTVGAWVAARR